MNKLRVVKNLLLQWREISRRREAPSGLMLGFLLILLMLVVKWPEAPPRIEPFIYAHF
jgi:hypothetical protein